MAKPRSPTFRGRASERDQLRRLLGQVRAGESAALVVRGEAGIGKTALIDHCAGQASSFAVARIAGMQAEMELPFAGLHQLCAPMLAEVTSLPDHQQNALEVALGLSSGDAPDRFLVALATLSLLAEVAAKRPLLCVIDDAQWLDAASAQVFGFVARRILAESVLMVFGVREPTEDQYLVGLPELRLSGLSNDDSRALLGAAVPGRVDAHVRDRLVAETHGNPLALLELPKDMTAAELAGGFRLPRSGDVPAQLEEHFLRRFEALPEGTQQLMLVAAAEPTGDVALLWRAAQGLGIGREAARAAAAAQLVEIGTTVQFRHPLVRSAIYSGASEEDRRAVHLTLAAATDPETDPDRQAWHRALAAAGPDEEIATELERSASRAQARGGLAAAAAFLERSAALTQEPAHRADRALAAAQAQVQAGTFEEARRAVAAAEIDAQTELQRARVALLRGRIAGAAGTRAEATPLLLKAARRLEPLDINLARETYLDAYAMAGNADPFGSNNEVLLEVAQAARAAPASPDPPRLCDLLLDGQLLLATEGLAAATPALRKAVEAIAGEALSVERGIQWAAMAAAVASMLWDFDSWHAIMIRQTELARRSGALAPLCYTLTSCVGTVAWHGELAAAAALAVEVDTLVEAIGLYIAPTGPLMLAALTGDEPHSSRFIEAAVDRAKARGEGVAAQHGLFAAAVLYNGLARYDQALASSRHATEAKLVVPSLSWTLPELVEAAVRTGNDALAAKAFERLAECTEGSASDWARGIFARCRALVSPADTAEEHYREAIEYLSRTALRPEHIRAILLYGEWLRRQNRRTDARHQLQAAYDMFSEMGMLAFAERALRELQATGVTVRKRQDDTRNDLTPQEDRIARLALDGKSNPEIGAQLFISARTVEWHLRRVYMKLGVTSRRNLRDALPTRAGTDRRN